MVNGADATVTVNVVSNDTSEGSVSPSTLTFTTANWDTSQTVTITGVDDSIIDGTQSYTVSLSASSSLDTTYDGVSKTLYLNNENDDFNQPPVAVTIVGRHRRNQSGLQVRCNDFIGKGCHFFQRSAAQSRFAPLGQQ